MNKILILLLCFNFAFSQDDMISFSGKIQTVLYEKNYTILDIKTRESNNIKVKILNSYKKYENKEKVMGNCLHKKSNHYESCYVFKI